MKYVIYIYYRCEYEPMNYDYLPMEAQTIEDAIIEADAKYNPDTMYLIKIMKKVGRVERVERGIRAQAFEAIMEKRSRRWYKAETKHIVAHYKASFGDWFGIV